MGSVTLRWVEGTMMAGTDSTGHSVVIGRSPDNPDEFVGMKPSDLALVGCRILRGLRCDRDPAKTARAYARMNVVYLGSKSLSRHINLPCIHLHYVVHGAVNAFPPGKSHPIVGR